MSNKQPTTLAMGLHCHQPVGNFPSVFEEITEESYEPFLARWDEADAPGTISFHASGPLLEWWSNHRPELIDRIGRLADEGELELLTAGFYEPILSLIPRQDRRRQVEKHLELLETLFDRRAHGAWLTERIWQPDLPEDLAPLGIEYAVVDDFHFQCAGWNRENVAGYYTTESNGQTLDIIPISEELRYRVPFHDVDDIEQFLNQSDHAMLTMADDGEKFGSWPDTHEWVYEDGWIDRFFDACSEGRILLCSLGEAREKHESNGRCYLPTASYQEMLEWALPAERQTEYRKWKHENEEDAKEHGRGGFFQHFLVKYEESNRLHKRMQWLSRRIDPDNHDARDHLLAGQCNDTYWHGVFGGLFLPHLRSAAWNHLCQAYAQSDAGTGQPEIRDYNRDGRQEVIHGDEQQFLVIDPHHGGALTTWELYPPARNVLDTLTRRWESYLTESSGEDDGGEAEVDTIHHRQTEVSPDWLEAWSEDPVPRSGFQTVKINMDEPTARSCRRNDGIDYPLHGREPKTVRVEDNGVRITYDATPESIEYTVGNGELTWTADTNGDQSGRWGVVSTFGIRSPYPEDARIQAGDDTFAPTDKIEINIASIEIVDTIAEYRLSLETKRPINCYAYPVNTISRSEEEAERIYQGTAFVMITDRENLTVSARWASLKGNE